MLLAHNPALRITPEIETHNPASQITPKIEAYNKAINFISTHAARVCKHVYYNSPARRKLASNSTSNLKNLKYVGSASQNPLNTSLAQQNTSKNKQPREPQFIQSKIPPIRRHSSNICKSNQPKKSVLFAASHSTIQSYSFNSTNSISPKSSSEIIII